jgi:hypothetical protein
VATDLQKKFDEAFELIRSIYPPATARLEIEEIQAAEKRAENLPLEKPPRLTDMLKRPDLRLALTAGIGMQVIVKTCLSFLFRSLLFLGHQTGLFCRFQIVILYQN